MCIRDSYKDVCNPITAEFREELYTNILDAYARIKEPEKEETQKPVSYTHLEEVNEDGEVKKADMFYKQTIKAKTVIDRVETAVEALNVSVNEFGLSLIHI